MAQPKFNLKVLTPYGEFTRKATRPYTHAVVRTSPRAMEAFENHSKQGCRKYGGVQGRWAKDRGYAVTWHGSEGAAKVAAQKPYLWDSKCGPAEVFAVQQDS